VSNKEMKSEAEVQAEIRAEAGRLGILLWRNNVGACTDDTGRTIRYGLGNDSAQLQRRLKSSDLIGVYHCDWCVKFGPDAFAHSCSGGTFLAVECKHEGWKFPAEWRDRVATNINALALSDDQRRTWAQWNFIHAVRSAGGLAGFALSVDDFRRILQGELVLP